MWRAFVSVCVRTRVCVCVCIEFDAWFWFSHVDDVPWPTAHSCRSTVNFHTYKHVETTRTNERKKNQQKVLFLVTHLLKLEWSLRIDYIPFFSLGLFTSHLRKICAHLFDFFLLLLLEYFGIFIRSSKCRRREFRRRSRKTIFSITHWNFEWPLNVCIYTQTHIHAPNEHCNIWFVYAAFVWAFFGSIYRTLRRNERSVCACSPLRSHSNALPHSTIYNICAVLSNLLTENDRRHIIIKATLNRVC